MPRTQELFIHSLTDATSHNADTARWTPLLQPVATPVTHMFGGKTVLQCPHTTCVLLDG